MEGLIVALIIGGIAGWLAGLIIKGYGFGLIGNIIVGLIGGLIGNWLWGVLRFPGIGPWWLTAIVSATVGAVILLVVIGLIRR